MDLFMNRLGGDGIPGPGAVPRSGANPGKLKHSLSCVLLWTPHLYDNAAFIAGFSVGIMPSRGIQHLFYTYGF